MLESILQDLVIEELRREGLGITARALEHLAALIHQVVRVHRAELLDRDQFAFAAAGLQEFLYRMVEFARATGADSVSEQGFRAARKQCGIVFWCK